MAERRSKEAAQERRKNMKYYVAADQFRKATADEISNNMLPEDATIFQGRVYAEVEANSVREAIEKGSEIFKENGIEFSGVGTMEKCDGSTEIVSNYKKAERRTAQLHTKILPSVKAMAEEKAAAEGRSLSNYIENLIKKGENTMIVMNEDLVLRKEGKYWTMYLGEHHCGCGDLEDMTEQLQEIGRLIESGESIEDILKEFEPR